jgi:hypothetical protein
MTAINDKLAIPELSHVQLHNIMKGKKSGYNITFQTKPTHKLQLIPMPSSTNEVISRAENKHGTLAFDADYGMEENTDDASAKLNASKVTCNVNVSRESQWHRDLMQISDMYKTKFLQTCLNQKDDFSDSPFKNLTMDDFDILYENTTFLIKDANPKFDPLLAVHITKKFDTGYIFKKMSKDGRHILIPRQADYKWDTMEPHLKKGSLIVSAEVECRYAFVRMSGNKITGISIRAEVHRLITKPAYKAEETAASNCKFEDEDEDEDEDEVEHESGIKLKVSDTTEKRERLTDEGYGSDHSPSKKLKVEE